MGHGTVKEVLSRIKYDPSWDEMEYYIIIEYRTRGGGTEKKIPVSEIELGRGYFFVGDAQIPYHRVLKIVKKDEVIWETRKIRL